MSSCYKLLILQISFITQGAVADLLVGTKIIVVLKNRNIADLNNDENFCCDNKFFSLRKFADDAPHDHTLCLKRRIVLICTTGSLNKNTPFALNTDNWQNITDSLE